MKEINWTKWSSIAEIISSMAILVTLIYLAVQTEQNTIATKSSLNQNMQQQFSGIYSEILKDGMTELWMRGNNSPLDLDDVEKLKYLFLFQQSIRGYENVHFQWKQGVFDEQQFIGWMNALHSISTSTGFRISWEVTKDSLSMDFRNYAETYVFDDYSAAKIREELQQVLNLENK